MNRVYLRLRSHGPALHRAHIVLSSALRSFFGRIERFIVLYHEQAILRSLDRRLLEDIGFETVTRTKYQVDHASRNEFTPPAEVFGLTRFQK
jgi:hypothetical protein